MWVLRGWAVTMPSPSPPEKASVVRYRVTSGVAIVQKRAGNMLSVCSASKSTYSPRRMRWQSFAGTAKGVVGGTGGAGVVPIMIMLSVLVSVVSFEAGAVS